MAASASKAIGRCTAWVPVLAEREGQRLHASIEELDLELSIDDRLRLADQLIQLLFETVPLPPSSTSSREQTRRLAVDRDAEPYGLPCRDGPMTRCRSRA